MISTMIPGAKKDDLNKYITEHLSNIQRREPHSTRSSSNESSNKKSNSADDVFVDGEKDSLTDEDDWLANEMPFSPSTRKGFEQII